MLEHPRLLEYPKSIKYQYKGSKNVWDKTFNSHTELTEFLLIFNPFIEVKEWLGKKL